MSELRDLYQEVILDHNRSPRNFRALGGATHKADGVNPLCGDKVTVFLEVHGDIIRNATFQGSGCAISMASASLMTESLKGKRLAEAHALFGRMHALLAEDEPAEMADLGKLTVFTGVREFPMRVKCATLAWHTLKAAMDRKGSEGPATTE